MRAGWIAAVLLLGGAGVLAWIALVPNRSIVAAKMDEPRRDTARGGPAPTDGLLATGEPALRTEFRPAAPAAVPEGAAVGQPASADLHLVVVDAFGFVPGAVSVSRERLTSVMDGMRGTPTPGAVPSNRAALVVESSGSPIRIPNQSEEAARYWVTAPGYGWSWIDRCDFVEGTGTVRLEGAGSLLATIVGVQPEDAFQLRLQRPGSFDVTRDAILGDRPVAISKIPPGRYRAILRRSAHAPGRRGMTERDVAISAGGVASVVFDLSWRDGTDAITVVDGSVRVELPTDVGEVEALVFRALSPPPQGVTGEAPASVHRFERDKLRSKVYAERHELFWEPIRLHSGPYLATVLPQGVTHYVDAFGESVRLELQVPPMRSRKLDCVDALTFRPIQVYSCRWSTLGDREVVAEFEEGSVWMAATEASPIPDGFNLFTVSAEGYGTQSHPVVVAPTDREVRLQLYRESSFELSFQRAPGNSVDVSALTRLAIRGQKVEPLVLSFTVGRLTAYEEGGKAPITAAVNFASGPGQLTLTLPPIRGWTEEPTEFPFVHVPGETVKRTLRVSQ